MNPFREHHTHSLLLAVLSCWLPMLCVTEAAPLARNLSMDLGGGISIELVLIPAGTFTMGGEPGQYPATMPGREIQITKPFYLGKTEVTQEQYQALMKRNPSHSKGARNPVETVTWDDAKVFCEQAGKLAGRAGRLPTEAEWEYACRAGTKTKYCNGEDLAALKKTGWANLGPPDDKLGTHPVALLEPNAWGLYDMHGNVFEWCMDWMADAYYAKAPKIDPVNLVETVATGRKEAWKVCRGGGAGTQPNNCTSAHRHSYSRLGKHTIGFRLLLEIKPVEN